MRAPLVAVWPLLGLYLLPLPASGQLSPEERRGRLIYMRGTSPSNKEIVALLDSGRTRVPATLMPCGNCHGPDGRGKPEGGVVPPDITWNTLTKPYGVYQPNGRSHAPYTDTTAKRAFTMGIDSSGHTLDPVMPRFQLSYEDAACLVAFMKKLGNVADPGISDASIRAGVVLPPAGRLPSMNQAVRKAIAAYFDAFNKDGGVYSRTIDLVFFEMPSRPVERAAAFRTWLQHESIFALTASYLAEAESELAPVLNDAETPSICAFALEPDLREPLNPYVFYLNSGLRGEVGQLVEMIKKRGPRGGRIAIVTAASDITRGMAGTAKAELSAAGWRVDETPAGAPACDGATQVIWLSPGSSMGTIRRCAEAAGGSMELFIPGSFGPSDLLDLPEALDRRVFVTLPAGELRGESHPAADALATARLLTLGLQNAGRNLTRQALIDALEGLYRKDLGNLEVSYGPNRRTGADPVVYTLDLRARRLVVATVDR